ncbi:hypothetical protein ACP4OV_006968 [Aristida adscensionis]
MDLSPKLFAVVIVLLLLGSPGMQGPVRVALAKECETRSHKFVGPCLRDQICEDVCFAEGFIGGMCGLRQRCFCSKNC